MQRNHCNCPVSSLQQITASLNQDTLPFESILQIGSELAGHLKTIIGCERCNTSKRITTMLSQITSRLVCFYEASYLNAATNPTDTTRIRSVSEPDLLLTPPVSQHGHMSPSSLTVQPTPACQSLFREMKLGKLHINGAEARMLVEVVLVDACLDLNEKIQEWRLILDESLEAVEEQCDATITRCLDRLAKLIGLLQFDGLPVEGS